MQRTSGTGHYVPLQVMGHHSLLRGTFSPKQLVAAAVRCGFDQIALTDRNSLMGSVAFIQEARAAGIRPIVGVDLEKEGFRVTVLARNRDGYAACSELVSARHLDPGFRPLREVASRIEDLAVLCSDPAILPRLHGALGGRHLYAAVVRVPGHQPARLLRCARALEIPAVAAGDVHFLHRRDHALHRMLRAVARNTVLERLDPKDVAPPEAVLLDPKAMVQRHSGEEALLRATRSLAAQCACEIELGQPKLPDFHLPGGVSAPAFLRKLVGEGARKRYGEPLPEGVRERLGHELEVIEALGFPGYFLVVREIVDFARRREIPFVGRGSAADSLVVYCLGFTRVDPLEHDLVFERFLSPSRRHLPDIDLDFCWRRRDEVIRHIYRRYGKERVATICTHTTFRFRSAFREVAKVLALPAATIGEVAQGLPYDHAAGLEEAVSTFPECRSAERGRRVISALRFADRLRGIPRHLGMHPGGMVIADRPITHYSPLVRSAKGPLITQHEMRGIEALGLVKMDILGQRSLTTVADTLALLRERGERCDLEAIAPDDAGVRDLLARGRTLGCFQVESPGMRKLLVEMRAADRQDVIDSVALIRPGPSGAGMKERFIRRRRGLEPVSYLHPVLEPVLRRTLGIMLYQEDVLRVTAALSGWSLDEGDLVRSALGKKKDPELLEQLRLRYLERAEERGIPEETARELWQQVGSFAAFSYCKAHAVTYGYLAYEELYLKSRFPAVFLCSVLNNDRGYYPDRVYLEEARRSGVRFLLPDVNRSSAAFAPEGDAIRIGLARVRGLHGRTLERLLEERKRRGPFLALSDFLERVRPHADEARQLVAAGALDGFDRPRPELLWRLDLAQRAAGPAEEGDALFASPPRTERMLPRLADYPEEEKRRMEYRALGLSAEGGEAIFGRPDPSWRVTWAEDLPEEVGKVVTCFGWCSATRRARSSEGRYMRFITLEDRTGTIEGVFFPDAYLKLGHEVRGEGPYLARGRIEADYGAPTLHIFDFRRWDPEREAAARRDSGSGVVAPADPMA